jgi:hypothetical protein
MSEEFGSCCATLKEVITSKEFSSLIEEGEDGVLYMSVGVVDSDNEEDGMVDYPVFYCPFCGTQLQEPDEEKAAS